MIGDDLAFLFGDDLGNGRRVVSVESSDLHRALDAHGEMPLPPYIAGLIGGLSAIPVWDLLQAAYDIWGVMPTLLERDFNFPPFAELLDEVDRIRSLQGNAGHRAATG